MMMIIRTYFYSAVEVLSLKFSDIVFFSDLKSVEIEFLFRIKEYFQTKNRSILCTHLLNETTLIEICTIRTITIIIMITHTVK